MRTLLLPLALLPGLLLGAPSSAQIVTEVIADTQLIAQGGLQTDTEPAGTVLLARGSTQPTGGVSVANGSLVCPWSARAGVGYSESSLGKKHVRFVNETSPPSGLCPTVPTIAGPHAIRIHFASPTSLTATLRVEAPAAVAGQSGYVVDVDNDGTPELASSAGPARYEQAVVLQPGQDLVVRVEAVSAGGNGMSIDVSLTPGTLFPTYGPSCTAELIGSYRVDLPVGPALDLEASGQTFVLGNRPFPIWVFGGQRLNLIVPPTNCPLLTDILVAIPTTITFYGSSRLTVAIPPGVSGVRLNAQFLTGYEPNGVPTWYVSNAVDVLVP